jgi:hypothetical protein
MAARKSQSRGQMSFAFEESTGKKSGKKARKKTARAKAKKAKPEIYVKLKPKKGSKEEARHGGSTKSLPLRGKPLPRHAKGWPMPLPPSRWRRSSGQ